jgi:4-hydroxy-3-methylbut-2-enyl diphosphate reductase
MEVIIDNKSGFCFGVKKAVEMADDALKKDGKLYCLGDIVHNESEVSRLAQKGLIVISREGYFQLSDCTVLLRAHGEPPEVFEHARQNNIKLLDGTCPVVLKLQHKVQASYSKLNNNGSIVIFGKPSHPEVIGLNGQIEYKAQVIESIEDLNKLDYNKPMVLYSQTTMSREKYWSLKMEIERRIASPDLLESNDTICGQVANRDPWLQEFSKSVDAIVFVGGKKSSNSKVLFSKCKEANSNSFFVGSGEEALSLSLEGFKIVGVCGATSTPRWLLDEVAQSIKHKWE